MKRRVSEPDNSRWHQFLVGEIGLQDMDDEELARATFRNAAGDFRGRPPKTVPRNFMQMVVREILRRGDSEIRQLYVRVWKEVGRIALYGDKEADRLRAANMLVERIAGKVPDRVEIKAERGFEGLVEALTGLSSEEVEDELAKRRERKEKAS